MADKEAKARREQESGERTIHFNMSASRPTPARSPVQKRDTPDPPGENTGASSYVLPPAMKQTSGEDHLRDAEESVSSYGSDKTPVEKIKLSRTREAKATRLPRARAPMREGDMRNEYVIIIIQYLEGVI